MITYRLLTSGIIAGLACFLFECTSDKNQFSPIDIDYCAQTDLGSLGVLSDYLDPLDDLATSKTGVYVLEEGDISMIHRAWLSEIAERSIDIQYFIFSGDNIGLIAVDYLLRAAERGVKVRLLVDDIMVEADVEDLLALDAHPNLSIKIYNPTSNIGKNLPEKLYSLSTDFRGFNQRMHNKTFTVDGKVVITGGRNIADEYFDYDHEYNFRDRDVLLIGKTTGTIVDSFTLFWESELSIPIADLVSLNQFEINSSEKMEYLHQYACNPQNFWPEVREKIQSVPSSFQQLQASGEMAWVDRVAFVSDVPGKNNGDSGLAGGGVCTDSLINLIAMAKSSIYIQSPYLVTTELSQRLFQRAVARGVEVKILTNSLTSTDNLEAFSGYKREREKLLSLGVSIYEFRPDAAVRFKVMTGALQKEMNFTPKFGLHAKSMVIDKEIAVIGTFNLDPRSANLNTECVAVIYDPTIAENLFLTMVEELKPENAWEITTSFNPDAEAGYGKQIQLWLRGIVPKAIL